MPVVTAPRAASSGRSSGVASASPSSASNSTTVIVNDLRDEDAVTSASFTLLRDFEPLPPEHQELNVRALQRRLMELKAQKEDPVQVVGTRIFTRRPPPNNNNNNNKPANGKALSKSFNNLATNNNNNAKCGYHRNCYTSGGGSNGDLAVYQYVASVQKNTNYRNNLNSQQRKKRSPEDTPKERPMFVTTVKTGRFLEPPPQLAALLGLSPQRRRQQQQVVLYSYSSQPRVVAGGGHRARCQAAVAAEAASKHKQPPSKSDGGLMHGNIMFDRRVVRGSTFAQHPVPTDGESQAARQAEVRRRALARRKAHAQQSRAMALRLGSPPPVAGRKHEVVQTATYLEEILDRPPEADACCQTDLFIDRPDTPRYVPAKTGIDKETQIYPGELFDFDVEVEPILEVLVGKTVEQAMMEVLADEEFAAMREQQRRMEERRAGEEAEIRRLEERELRFRQEKDRRVSQLTRALKEQQEAEERVAAALLTRGYLQDALPAVLKGLKEDGYRVDCIRDDVIENFMPWLMSEVRQQMDQVVASRQVLTELVKDIVISRRQLAEAMIKKEEEEEQLRLLKEQMEADVDAAADIAMAAVDVMYGANVFGDLDEPGKLPEEEP